MDENEDEVILRLPEDTHRLCRTCMTVTENEQCHEVILVKEDRTGDVGEMLKSCCSILAMPDDGLPKSICEECATKLEILFQFKIQCKETDKKLRELLGLPEFDNRQEKESKAPSSSGIESCKTNLTENLIENTEDNCTVKSEYFSPQFDVYQLIGNIEESAEPEETDLNSEDELIISLIDERKADEFDEVKVATKSSPPVKFHSVEIKQEIFDDDNELDHNESSPDNDSCRKCQMIFDCSEDLHEHEEVCRTNHKTVLEKILKLENGTLDKIELYDDDAMDDQPPFLCSICGNSFKTKYARNTHMSTHGPVVECEKASYDYACDICDKVFFTSSILETHFYRHAIEINKKLRENTYRSDEEDEVEDEEITDPLRCNICQERFEKAVDLSEHTKKHTKSGTVICEICNSLFSGEINLAKHLRRHGIQISICKICLKRFNNPMKLKEHMNIHRTESRTNFNCPLCKISYSSLEKLIDHSLEHLGDMHECEHCKRTFNSKTTYDNHVKQHKDPRYLCAFCGKQYFTSVSLAAHVRAHNNEKPFICSECNKGFSSRATLSVHKRIHSKLKPYVCSYCGYSCRQSGDLTMHIRTHTGDKPYKCTFPNCERKFTTSSQRREHYRRHTNERNHKCTVCKKAFLESKTLKVHMLTHTGEKPHVCKVCNKKFRRTHHLTNHMKGHREFTDTNTIFINMI